AKLPDAAEMRNGPLRGFPASFVLLHFSARTPSFPSLLFYGCSYKATIKDRKRIRLYSSYCYTYPPMCVKPGAPAYLTHKARRWEEKKTWRNESHSSPAPSARGAVSSSAHSY